MVVKINTQPSGEGSLTLQTDNLLLVASNGFRKTIPGFFLWALMSCTMLYTLMISYDPVTNYRLYLQYHHTWGYNFNMCTWEGTNILHKVL